MDVGFDQGLHDCACVIVQGPSGSSRISNLDEADVVAKRGFEAGDEGPISMKARQIDQSGLGRRARDANPDAIPG